MLPLETPAGLDKHTGITALENKSCFWIACNATDPLTESLQWSALCWLPGPLGWWQTKEGHWALPSLWELVAQLGR